MRLHITLDDDLVHELDRHVGPRRRSGFITSAVENALHQERNWELIESAIGSVPSKEHDWDGDPAEWVREQRRSDRARVG